MKQFSITTILASATVVAFLSAPNIAYGDGFTFGADLSGAQEVTVPSGGVVTSTTGRAQVTFSEDLSMGMFRVTVEGGLDVVAAHIHCGAAGVNGPVTVTLFSGPAVDVDGELAEGTLVNADITDICGINVASLRAAMVQEGTYVNVHTLANPGGEIRGQLLEADDDDDDGDDDDDDDDDGDDGDDD